MTWLVVWFMDGQLHRSTVCRSQRTTKRIANSFNEYAQKYNQFSKHVNVVGVVSDSELLKVFEEHIGLPQHTPLHKLKAQREVKRCKRDIAYFKALPVKGGIQ